MRLSEKPSRRVAAGICLIAGPGLALAGWSVFPSVAESDEVWVSDIADNASRAAGGIALATAGIALSVLAYMALVHLLRERRSLAGDIGGGMTIVGAALTAALMGVVYAQVEAIRHLGDSAQTAALLKAIDDSSAAVILWLGPVVLTLGLVVLSVALAQAHATPPLFAALLGVGAVTQFVGLFVAFSMAVVIAGFAAMFVALASIGVQLLMETDEEWEHAPVFEGFHRASTA